MINAAILQPDRIFYNFRAQDPPHAVPKLNKSRHALDCEALKLRKGRSGGKVSMLRSSSPTEHFTVIDPSNPSIDVSENIKFGGVQSGVRFFLLRHARKCS